MPSSATSSRGHDGVVHVRNGHSEPPAPLPADVILARLEAAEEAAAARHAELLARLAAVEKAVAGAVDSADCANVAVAELQARTRGWLEQLLDEVLDAVEAAPGD